MATGVVKVVNLDRGFGFIKSPDGKEYFFHHSELQNCNINELDDRTRVFEVDFTIVDSKKGPRAEKVNLVR